MLVISRRAGQKIVFPELGVSIEVVHSRGSAVRLGIVAPDSVRVLREEVLKRTASGLTGSGDAPKEADRRCAALPDQSSIGDRSASLAVRHRKLQPAVSS